MFAFFITFSKLPTSKSIKRCLKFRSSDTLNYVKSLSDFRQISVFLTFFQRISFIFVRVDPYD